MRTVLGWRGDMHIFQHRKFVVHDRDDLFQTLNGDSKVDTAHAITVPERDHYAFFILRGEVLIWVIKVNDEREGW